MNCKYFGFTLIELMVVLGILAATATIALRTASSLQNQGRYQQTTRELNNIQGAIVGPTNERAPDNSSMVTGFVADTGRLPEFLVSPYDSGDADGYSDPLNELLSRPSYTADTIPPYQLYQSNTDPSVEIGVGWQGPYVQVGAGPSYIRDGWGFSLQCYSATGVLITQGSTYGPGPGTQIAQIASWGADDMPDANHEGSVPTGNAYNDDVSIPNPTITVTTPTSAGFAITGAASITGQVTMNMGTDLVGGSSIVDGGPGNPPNLTFSGTPVFPVSSNAVAYVPVSIWVAYFGPDLTQSPNPVATDPVLVDYNTEPAATTANAGAWNTPWTTGQFPTISGSNVTIGPRVLKVYVLPATVINATGSNRTAFNYYVQNASVMYPIYAESTLNVTLGGGTQTINLTLPHYSP